MTSCTQTSTGVCLLGKLVVFISFLYLFATVRDTRRKRQTVLTVSSPTENFFVLNQFSTTSSANLAARRRQPHTHRLGPFTSIALFIVLQAAEFSGALDQEAVSTVDVLLQARCLRMRSFKDAQLTTSIICVVAMAVLILLNLFSGIGLLPTLRQIDDRQLIVPRNTPLVAPLQPLQVSNGAVVTLADVTDAGEPAAWESKVEACKLKLRRLKWDVVLFFISVVPSALAFIGDQAWYGALFSVILHDPAQLEFGCIGMIWIFAFFSFLCIASLTIKTFLSLRTASK
ncbi:hypothetical protein JCM11641_002474 [Rhodosporidiobolus odoratus]